MIRTVNRQPLSVATPNEKNIREYSTNQMEWKGLNDDKNFVTVDQNSYQDCKNVYVDSEGLLRSRPSIKALNNSPSNVLDYYVFANCIAYKYHNQDDDKEYICFVQNGVNTEQMLDYGTSTYDKIQLVEADNKIFVFTVNHLYVYNTDTSQITDATNDIYIPETEIYSDGVKTDSGESPNLLTDSYYKTYIYTGIGEPNYALFIGKDIKVKLDNTEYDITNFKRDQELTFLHKIASVNNDSIEGPHNPNEYGPLGRLNQKHAYISISSTGSMLVSNYINLNPVPVPIPTPIDPSNLGYVPNLQWSIYYTVDGRVYNKLPYLADILGEPHISETGEYAFCITKTGVYVISLIENYYDSTTDTTVKKYENWYKLDTISNLNDLPTTHASFRQNIYVNGYFIDDENYALVYGSNTVNNQGATEYPLYNRLNFYVKYNGTAYPADTRYIDVSNGYTYTCYPKITAKLTQKLDIFVSFVWRNTNTNKYIVEYYDAHSDNNFSFNRVGNGYASNYISNSDAMYIGDNFKVYILLYGSNMYYRLWDSAGNVTTNTGSSPVSVQFNNVQFGTFAPYLHTNKGLYVLKDKDDIKQFLTEQSFRENLLEFAYNDLLVLQSYNGISYYLNGTDLLSTTNQLTIKELVSGEGPKYVVPDKVSKLENYFMSFGNKTYISKIVSTDFKWYLPLDSENKYESEVTNLHPISSTEMAIFLKDAIYYTVWDGDLSTYRYFKSKIQVGCRPECDVITTFDGKYVIFTSERGLVAMNYQDFVATTDQSLTYISDTIYQVFYDYMTEHSAVSGQIDAIQLYKYAYWIIVYKNNSTKGLIFDLRNNTWWPFESFRPIVKIVTEKDKPKLLIGRSLYKLDIADTNYYDYDGDKHNVSWFILSQKMYLGALNYYKHIVNITFNSVHDVTLLNNSDYNINELVFKLQVNNYRKTLNGNVDTKEYESVNYIVNSAKTVIQRLNYSKVHEFQYKLSNADTVFRLPLSLTAMSVKYKVGGQIR